MASASSSASVIDFPAPTGAPIYVPPAGEIVVRSSQDYEQHAELLKTIKGFQARVAEFFRPHKDRAHQAHAALCAEEKKALLPAQEHEARIKRALVAYTTEQDRLRRIEEQRKRDELRRQEETRRLDEAAALEREAHETGDAGMREQAQQLIEAPIPLMPVVVDTPAAPKVSGLSFREVYKAEVSDLLTLVKAVAAGQQPITLLQANQTALDGMARALKDALAIPGVRLVKDRIAASR